MIEPPSEPVSHPDDSVRAFLAARNVPCPGCNYNLRGVEQPVCPECGRGIELTIARPGNNRGYLLFVLLALCWVMAAGTMNGVRAWEVVRQEAMTNQWLSQAFGAATPGSFRITTPSTRGSSQTTITIPQTTTRSGSSVVISGGSMSFSSFGTISTSGSTGYLWSNVSQQSWLMLGWWGGLGILSLVWLIVCLGRRRRFDTDRPPRSLVAGACILFALYAGYHAIMFTREMLT